MNWETSPLPNQEVLMIKVKDILPPYGNASPLFEDTVQFYLDLMKSNTPIPAISIHYDSMKIQDGYHRYNAYKRLLKNNPNLPKKIPVYRWKRCLE